jgi:uncharacterized protein
MPARRSAITAARQICCHDRRVLDYHGRKARRRRAKRASRESDAMMRAMRVLGLAAVVGAAALAGAAKAQMVSIVTTPAGSYTNSAGAAMAKVLIDHAKLRTVVQAQAANGLDAIAAGTADFGLSNSFDLTFFIDGTQYYKSEGPHKNLRYVASFQPYRVGMFVRASSPIQTIHELKGHRVSSDFNAQKTIATIIEAHLANGGLTYKDVNGVPAPNVVRAAEDFDSGKVDVLFFAIGSAAVKQAAATVGGIRALPLDTAPEAIERMQAVMPGSYVVHVDPAPNLDGISKPTSLIAFDMVLYTSDKAKDDVVYRAVKALYENKAELAGIFAPFRGFDPKTMAKPVKDAPYHPGALKFYKEVGIAPAS